MRTLVNRRCITKQVSLFVSDVVNTAKQAFSVYDEIILSIEVALGLSATCSMLAMAMRQHRKPCHRFVDVSAGAH